MKYKSTIAALVGCCLGMAPAYYVGYQKGTANGEKNSITDAAIYLDVVLGDVSRLERHQTLANVKTSMTLSLGTWRDHMDERLKEIAAR